MADEPVVSVIMNCYNSDKYLKEAIQSVIDQTFQNWEIIFWDNQSTDKSAEIVRSFKDSRIKYFYAVEHTPLGAARNLAFERCAGRYVAFLDCDDTWLPSKLEKQVQLMETRPDVDFIYGNHYVLDVKKKKSSVAMKTVQPEGDIFGHLLHDNVIGILTVMIRKDILDRFDPLFDPKLSLTEDYELFMRILYSSKAAYIHEPLAAYKIHADMSSMVHKDNWAGEFEYLIKKIKELDKENLHTKGIESLEKQAVLRDALINLTQGNMRKARTLITPHKYDNLKNFIFYIATFLPVSIWFFLRPVWSRRLSFR